MASITAFAGRTFGSPTAPNVIEAYLDFICPYSKKIFEKLVNEVLPAVEKQYPGKLRFVFRHQVQPWHPQGTLVHEAAIAVARLDPDKFAPFAKVLFERQTDFFDLNTYDKSRQQIYNELSILASTVGIPSDSVPGLLARIKDGSFLNTGNAVTDAFKIHLRLARQNAIHVSPTCLFNGLIENSISSGWNLDEWMEYLGKKIA